eukprot:9645160-Alexandrium_andersonii.AAC.1
MVRVRLRKLCNAKFLLIRAMVANGGKTTPSRQADRQTRAQAEACRRQDRQLLRQRDRRRDNAEAEAGRLCDLGAVAGQSRGADAAMGRSNNEAMAMAK